MISGPLKSDAEMEAEFQAWLDAQIFEGSEEEQAAARQAEIAAHEAAMQARRVLTAKRQAAYNRKYGYT